MCPPAGRIDESESARKGRPDRTSAGNRELFETLHDHVFSEFIDRQNSQSLGKL
jgi:hypothetical protein